MARTEPAFTALGQGLQLRVYTEIKALDGNPADWPLDELGAPLWIVSAPLAHMCQWVPLVPPIGSEALTSGWEKPWPAGARELSAGAMPSLDGVVERSVANRRSRGNPGVAKTAPHEARAAAWLHDLRGYSTGAITRALLAPGSDRRGERSARRQAARYINAGRVVLHRERVLPWCLFPSGHVRSEWWNDARFRAWLDLWYLSGLRSSHLASLREQTWVSRGRMVLLDMFERGLPPPPIALAPSRPRSPEQAALHLSRAVAMLAARRDECDRDRQGSRCR
jgi:hypothetical protein